MDQVDDARWRVQVNILPSRSAKQNARVWDFPADRYGCWERPFTLKPAILEVPKTASTKTATGAPGISICTSSRSSGGQFWPLENEYGNA
ncbi:hypothetical protein [Novosphingobium sp. SG916]|uniref:hypothetical protein n=1 Tax=Novosphingobium sp. SG916 TaxID=2587131 RepID=UPI00146BDB3C|nr:hypothetical protein [Novosphingobium sp. SG916]NMN07589.1 hypothetical protein [Novosphingobium sp. SG919]